MSTSLAPFAFDGQEVRVGYDADGEPWFCTALGCPCPARSRPVD